MSNEFKYTLAFIKHDNHILMINREKSPWKGSWNGVGGKLLPGESKEECIKREIVEETGYVIDNVQFKGILTWENFDAKGMGLYLFVASLEEDVDISKITPTSEGILAWKEYSWIISQDNIGVAKNIPHFLPAIVEDNKPIHCHCVFNHYQLLEVSINELTDEWVHV